MAPTYELYSYFRSSCSARVRIAAHLKGIELTYHFIHLVKGEQHSESYAAINPSESVPTLVVNLDGGRKVSIRQSMAILEFLEENHPSLTQLLPPPSDPIARANVRELVNIIACDVQPVTNLRILQRVKALTASPEEWANSFITQGLRSYEQVVSECAGKFSHGNNVTLADVVLSPAVDGALRFGVNIEEFPTINRIYGELQKIPAFQRGSWRSQPDTPEEFRQASSTL